MQTLMALLVAAMIGPGAGASVVSAVDATVSAEAVVMDAYAQWHSSLGVRGACSEGVSIVFETLPSRRGEYLVAAQQVVIDLGDESDGMAGIVIHELSHHTFLSCAVFADAEFSEAFYTAQGIPEGRDWFDYSGGWSSTPAEYFAEALTVTISGSGEGGLDIGSETVGVVSRWLSGAAVAPDPTDSYQPIGYADNQQPEANAASGGDSNPLPDMTPSSLEIVQHTQLMPSREPEVAQPDPIADIVNDTDVADRAIRQQQSSQARWSARYRLRMTGCAAHRTSPTFSTSLRIARDNWCRVSAGRPSLRSLANYTATPR